MKPSSVIVLAVTVFGSLAGWLIAAPTWHALAQPQAIGGLFAILASTLGAAFGVNTKGSQS